MYWEKRIEEKETVCAKLGSGKVAARWECLMLSDIAVVGVRPSLAAIITTIVIAVVKATLLSAYYIPGSVPRAL